MHCELTLIYFEIVCLSLWTLTFVLTFAFYHDLLNDDDTCMDEKNLAGIQPETLPNLNTDM